MCVSLSSVSLEHDVCVDETERNCEVERCNRPFSLPVLSRLTPLLVFRLSSSLSPFHWFCLLQGPFAFDFRFFSFTTHTNIHIFPFVFL
jgi:hypothetical protein